MLNLTLALDHLFGTWTKFCFPSLLCYLPCKCHFHKVSCCWTSSLRSKSANKQNKISVSRAGVILLEFLVAASMAPEALGKRELCMDWAWGIVCWAQTSIQETDLQECQRNCWKHPSCDPFKNGTLAVPSKWDSYLMYDTFLPDLKFLFRAVRVLQGKACFKLCHFPCSRG